MDFVHYIHANKCQNSGRTRRNPWREIVTLCTDVNNRRDRAYSFTKTTPKLKISLHLFIDVSLCFHIDHSGKYFSFIKERNFEHFEIFLNDFTIISLSFKFDCN